MKDILVVVGIVVALLLGVVGISQPAFNLDSVKELVSSLGAQSQQVTDGSGCYVLNGIRTCVERKALNTATTTSCAIKSPNATSTVVRSWLKIDTSTSTATLWTVAKAATAFATTTKLTQAFSLASGVQGTMAFTGSSTPLAVTPVVDDVPVVAPNQYIVWGVQGTTIAGTTFLQGTCGAVFEVI